MYWKQLYPNKADLFSNYLLFLYIDKNMTEVDHSLIKLSHYIDPADHFL